MGTRREFMRAAWAAVASGVVLRAVPVAATARLQMLDGGAARLHWVTVKQGKAEVEWVVGEELWRAAEVQQVVLEPWETGLPDAVEVILAELRGLESGAEVRYRVKWDGVEQGGEGRFRTEPGPGEPLLLLALGDSGMGNEDQAAVAAAMAREAGPALVLHTGDLGYPVGSYEDLRDRFLKPYAEQMKTCTFVCTPGNHEYYSDSVKPYLRLQIGPGADRTWHGLKWGAVQVIAVDSNDPLLRPAEESEMLRWFEAQLKASRAFWRIVIFHHPPYTNGVHAGDPFVAEAKRKLAPLVERYGVPLVLTGHEHLYHRTVAVKDGQAAADGRGTTYITTGGGGGPLYPFTAHELTAQGRSVHHFLRLKVEARRLTVEAVDRDGGVFDGVQIDAAPVVFDVVNGAQAEAGLAPGCLAQVRGSQLNDGGEVRVYVDGQEVEVLDGGVGVLRFQVPESAGSRVAVRVETEYGSAGAEGEVLETAPALFAPAVGRVADAGRPTWLLATGLGGGHDVAMFAGEMELELLRAPVATTLAGVYRVDFLAPGESGAAAVRLRAGERVSAPVPLVVN